MDGILPYIPLESMKFSPQTAAGNQTCNGASTSFPIKVGGSIIMASVTSNNDSWLLLPGSDEIEINYVGIPGSHYDRYYLYISCIENTLTFRIEANTSDPYNMGTYSYTILYIAS